MDVVAGALSVDPLLGMGKAGKKFILLLDIDRVLSLSELEAAPSLEAAPAEGSAIEALPEPGVGASEMAEDALP